MKLIVITQPQFFRGEADAICELFESGLEILHLRKPGATQDEVEQLLKTLPPKYMDRIVMHEHVSLALRYKLRGIHLSARNPYPPIPYQGTTSYSCHTNEEVDIWSYRCTYVFLSPIYDSISKQGYASNFTYADLRYARDCGIIGRNVIALGGITPKHIPQIRSAGFGGVAVLGDLWNRRGKDRIERLHEFLQTLDTSPVVLTIAGSDCSGGAGVQADIKTISAMGAYAAAAITAITVQNTRGVQEVSPVAPEMVHAQIRAVLDDLPVGAVKIGMIPNLGVLRAILDALAPYPDLPVVYDPVMVSTSGRRLMQPETLATVQAELLPRCILITPNLPEASVLTGMEVNDPDSMKKAALFLNKKYHQHILVKGGHLSGNRLCDAYCHFGDTYFINNERIVTQNLHGTGCTLSSALATGYAKGLIDFSIVGEAESYLQKAIRFAKNWRMGDGNGPLCHFFTENGKVI